MREMTPNKILKKNMTNLTTIWQQLKSTKNKVSNINMTKDISLNQQTIHWF